MKKSFWNRRDVLRSAAAFAATTGFVRPTWADAPSERLGIGIVGLGGMGTAHLQDLLQRPGVQVTGLCDVDAGHLEAAQKLAPTGCFATKDFRELVGRPEVDAVFVVTPDHWHALIVIAAANAKKHIYCEKPLANSVAEGRAMVEAVRANQVVLQVGSHERSNPGAEAAKRLISAGKLGEIHTVRIQLPNAEAHLQEVVNFTSPPADKPAPAGLDYDFWIGPAAERPYNEKRSHFWWRFHSQYGGGEMTDRGCHVIDLAHLILGLDDTGPVKISAKGELPKGDFFDAFINFEFENVYANGLKMIGANSGERGVKFEGTEGSLFVKVHGADLVAEPASLLADVKLPAAEHHAAHRRDFFEAIRTGEPPIAPVEAGHRTATVCHLNNIAMRLGAGFDWNPQTETASFAAANELLSPKMREPWKL